MPAFDETRGSGFGSDTVVVGCVHEHGETVVHVEIAKTVVVDVVEDEDKLVGQTMANADKMTD